MTCSLVGLPRLGNKILYSIEEHGGVLARLLFELPENFTSLLEWIDFLIPKQFEGYVSRVEKVVLDDFFGFRGRAYGLITLYSDETDFRGILKDGITIYTSESQPFEYHFLGDDGCITDFIYSYSVFYPSRFRPEYIHPDFKFYVDDYIGFYNVLGCINKNNLQPEVYNGVDIVLYPPNLFGGRIDSRLFFPEYNDSFEVLSRGDEYVKHYLDVLDGFKHDGLHIFPLIFNDGLSFEGGYIIVDGKPKYFDDLRLEFDGLTIDLAWEVRGMKPSLSFKRFRSVASSSGRKYLVNIGFREFPPPPSHRFIEFRIGSKLVWSSSSVEGLIRLKLV